MRTETPSLRAACSWDRPWASRVADSQPATDRGVAGSSSAEVLGPGREGVPPSTSTSKPSGKMRTETWKAGSLVPAAASSASPMAACTSGAVASPGPLSARASWRKSRASAQEAGRAGKIRVTTMTGETTS